jgi:hypothetical protein
MNTGNAVYIRLGETTADYREAVADEKAGHRHLSFSQAAERHLMHENSTGVELVQCSRSDLIEKLNKRAAIVNPAGFLYVLGAIGLAFGISLISSIVQAAKGDLQSAIQNVATAIRLNRSRPGCRLPLPLMLPRPKTLVGPQAGEGTRQGWSPVAPTLVNSPVAGFIRSS